MSGFRTAYVYVRNDFAGILKETDAGYSFKYDTAYIQKENASAVSLTLPLRVEAYNSGILFPFFDGLIPEGWLFKIVTINWKIDSHDRFGVLLVACRDGIGNVLIRGGIE